MLKKVLCHATASLVAFFVGWTVFAITPRVVELPVVQPPARKISEIRIKHLGCPDAELKCSVSEANFRSTGKAAFIGYANDEFIGRYEANYPPQDFASLAEQIEQQGFFDMPVEFQSDAIEEKIVIEVVTDEGLNSVTTYNWSTSPVRLRVVQALVDYETYRLTWDESN